MTRPQNGNGHPERVTALVLSLRTDLAEWKLTRDPWGRLHLIEPNGQQHVGVEPVRAFPFSDTRAWVSLVDGEGRELLCLPDLSSVSPEFRQLIEETLATREFLPVISRIRRISSGPDPTEWTVRTERGDVSFVVNSDEDIRRLEPRRLLIKDSQGMRYLIEDIRQLDAASQRFLTRFV